MNLSILDVAKRAGVSKSTVSRVLTGGSVSEKTRQAVYRAMEELQYTPNRVAQGLRGASTKVVGVALYREEGIYSWARVSGINDMLAGAGYSLLLINLETRDDAQQVFRYMDNHLIDGLIFMDTNVESDRWRQMVLDYRKVVYTGERFDPSRGFRIYMGNYHYSRDIYCYMMAKGHKKILTVWGAFYRPDREYFKRRIVAYEEACRCYHLPFDPDNHIGPELEETGAKILESKTYLQLIYERFVKGGYTAIFAESMEMAHNIIAFFAGKGMQLLKDYSIAAIEREGMNRAKDLTITAISLPDYEYGGKCARLLLDAIQDEKLVCRDVIVPYTLEIRHSVQDLT